MLPAGLVSEADTCVFDCNTLDLCERQFPLQTELVRPEGEDFRGREENYVVPSGKVCKSCSGWELQHMKEILTNVRNVGLAPEGALI